MGSPRDDFDTLVFEKKLTSLTDTQDTIRTLSSWCLQRRQHHKKIVASWLNVLKRAKVEQRLVLFYLANDVIQYSKRKNYEFVESWGTTLQKATPLVRDDKVKHKILRIFRIWEERKIYDDEFLTDLTGLLSVTAGKQALDLDPNDFQAMQLVNKIKQCAVLEAETDHRLKLIHECPLPLHDSTALCTMLKERRDLEEGKTELDDGVVRMENYINALQKELVARAALCRLLQKANIHYGTQRGEVKMVANAYKNFGIRVRGLKRKLDELCKQLPLAKGSPVPSPPSPDEPVPSPGPDEDLDLPSSGHQDTSNMNNFENSFGTNMTEEDFVGKSFRSFVGNVNFTLSSFASNITETKSILKTTEEAKKIEVINTRPSNTSIDTTIDIHSLLKSLIPSKLPHTVTNNDSVYRPRLTPPPPPPPILPGLDLITADAVDSVTSLCSSNNLNFYGTNSSNTSVVNTPDINLSSDVYENNQPAWNNSWELQKHLSTDTPESPPVEQMSSPKPPPIIPVPPPVPDVDHRQLLAPPPIPQVLLKTDDVDHRILPPLPPLHLPPTTDRNRQTHQVDVDHRNLIPLTMSSLPPPPAPPISPWATQSSHADQDYRGVNEEYSSNVPPPLPPSMSVPPPVRRLPSHNDNVESIDMEMSDEENHDEEYSRHMRIESSMARIHGHPPPPIPHHNQLPVYRKQESVNRDKSFHNNNNRLLVDGTQIDMHNNMKHKNDGQLGRTNLVRINSSDNMDHDVELNQNSYQQECSGSNDTGADIFTDFPTNAMNPINPNVNIQNSGDGHQESHLMGDKYDEEWERSDDENNQDPWKKRAGLMNPMTPNYGIIRPIYNQRPPPLPYRRPPPLLSTPTFIDEKYFNPTGRTGRGNHSFRRPWGHQRPPRGGYW